MVDWLLIKLEQFTGWLINLASALFLVACVFFLVILLIVIVGILYGALVQWTV